MQFKTQQALTLAGISDDKLRHWKSILSPLNRFDGRKDGFTLEQVVALAVINCAVSRLKLPIATFAPHAEEIFDAVTRFLRSGGPAVLYLHDGKVTVEGIKKTPDADALIAIRMDLVAEQVRGATIDVEEAQLDLLTVKPA